MPSIGITYLLFPCWLGSRTTSSRVKVIDFNIREWLLSKECLDYAKAAQTIELGYTQLFKVADQYLRDGVVITGHEEPYVFRQDIPNEKSKWIFHCHERHYSIHKFFMASKIDAVPSFFQWSTELLNSFMTNDHWVAMFNGMYANTIWASDQLKYGFLGKTLALAARTKYTSFEKIIHEIQDSDDAWQASLPFLWNRTHDFEVFDWFRRCGVTLTKGT
jgi:hypothetical protein